MNWMTLWTISAVALVKGTHSGQKSEIHMDSKRDTYSKTHTSPHPIHLDIAYQESPTIWNTPFHDPFPQFFKAVVIISQLGTKICVGSYANSLYLLQTTSFCVFNLKIIPIIWISFSSLKSHFTFKICQNFLHWRPGSLLLYPFHHWTEVLQNSFY